METSFDDLDLSQAQAFALQSRELDALLETLDASLTASLRQLRSPTCADDLLRALHDLKGYLGLVAKPELCVLVQAVYAQARLATDGACAVIPAPVLVRLEMLQQRLAAYRAGIIPT